MSGYREVFKRKEIKYLIDEDQYRKLLPYLEEVAKTDEYGLSKINNIYFDTRDYRLVRTSMEKPFYKEKLRLRTYGKTEDSTNAFIEIKKKYDGIVYKRRIHGEYGKALEYLTGKNGLPEESQIAREIDAFKNLYGELIPAMKICYDRVAMAGKEDKDFRVTFDSNIQWSADSVDLRSGKPGWAVLKRGQYLMEIKISNAFPMALSRKLSEFGIFPTSFSKYGAGYTDMMKGRTEKITETQMIVFPGTAFNRKEELAYV